MPAPVAEMPTTEEKPEVTPTGTGTPGATGGTV
jgi:hypothetical protein